VLGDRFVVSGPWRGIRTDTDPLRRYALPAHVAPSRETVTAPAPIVDPDRYDHPDLPPAPMIDEAKAIALPDAGTYSVAHVAIDPGAPQILYTLPLEQRPTDALGAGVAALDLSARRWLWHRADGCPPGTPIALSVAPRADAIVCAARVGEGRAAVRATSRHDGHVMWSWSGPVDAIVAGGGAVAVIAASRVVLLDARTGAELDRFGADDGWMPRVALVELAGGTTLISAERGLLVARALPSRWSRWSVRVRGTVTSLLAAGDRVAVTLADGSLYFLDPATGAATPAGTWDDAWRTPGGGDLAIAQARDPERREWRLAAYSSDGVSRFRIALTLAPDWLLGPGRGRVPGAPLALAWGPALRAAAVIDAKHGALRTLVSLPDRAVPGLVFATVVDGTPVAGAVLSHPLAVVTF